VASSASKKLLTRKELKDRFEEEHKKYKALSPAGHMNKEVVVEHSKARTKKAY
jgi:hypothetical protein